ncbi:DUF4386 family protein [Rubrobacter tropicus]|uniref:DUF4386 family protein n=1 Tax=Rubrobacter tropicus TaxID=2653851 RepID=A0A6G8QDY1_9ACTN|nr:DUF4386 family protein [Rubrobacter tropicus]QIN84714.1 DUF4386 family protein [Rubrobacter tropicus]
MKAPDARVEFVGRPHASRAAGSGWGGLYKIGGAAAMIGVLLVLLDILAGILLPGGEVEPGARSAVEWFELFRDDAYHGFRELGLLNVLNIILGIPLFLALYAVHRRVEGAYATLALVLFLFGGAIYISNNAAVPMFVLSEEHAAATTDAQRAALAAAGEAVLARGADFTPGSLVGFVLPSLGQIVMSLVMLRGGVFGRATAYMGIAGFALLLVFTVWTTLVPGALGAAMLIAVPAGLLVVAWNVLVALRLFRLSGTS